MAVEYEPDSSVLATARKDQATYDRLAAELSCKDGSIPLAKRLRTLFTIKSLGGRPAIEAIGAAFAGEPSCLLKHELGYVLGQMQSIDAVPVLEAVLADEFEESMVRHEAAEALGAIASRDALPVLERYVNDRNTAVRETCQLAVDLIKFHIAREENPSLAKEDVLPTTAFCSVDPAPGLTTTKTVEELQEMLMDTSLTMFQRYRAMFTLRNINTSAAALAVASGFGDSSALFRHEVAYVLGQMQHSNTIEPLVQRLADEDEVGMVRHEAAEALGSIAHPDVVPVLQRFVDDDIPVVRESCIVGLDMVEYENSMQFQYADGLQS